MGLLLAGVIHSEGVLCGSRETGKQHRPRRRRAGWFYSIRTEGRVPLGSEGLPGTIGLTGSVGAFGGDVGSSLD